MTVRGAERLAGRRGVRVDQSRNGVRVVVWRSDAGSVVEADCQCFGMVGRVHSRDACPVRLRAVREAS